MPCHKFSLFSEVFYYSWVKQNDPEKQNNLGYRNHSYRYNHHSIQHIQRYPDTKFSEPGKQICHEEYGTCFYVFAKRSRASVTFYR